MINPIEHSKTIDAANKYRGEPYIIPADIYGAGNLLGRAGWTWYTGSSSWYIQTGIEHVLGFKIEKGYLIITPKNIKDWKSYSFRYRYENTVYNIEIKFGEKDELLSKKYKEEIITKLKEKNLINMKNEVNSNNNDSNIEKTYLEYFKQNNIVIVNEVFTIDNIKLVPNSGIINIVIYAN